MALEELRRTLAQIFVQAGKETMDEKEFKLKVSMDLKWFSPAEAVKLLGTARAAGLLKKRGKRYMPTFAVKDVEVPLEFKPSKKVLEVPETPLFTKVVDAIIKATDQERTAVVAKINKKHEKLDIDVRVVALMVAKEAGVDISLFVTETEEHIVDTYGISRGGSEEEE
jgi:hypothetical protein